ncbi:Conserved oligomeric Golgi complex subunit 2, partial [Manis javanica]
HIAGITVMLQRSLEGLLLEGLQTSNVDIIQRCLRIYATIDKTWDAEALLGQVLVKRRKYRGLCIRGTNPRS